MIPWMIFFRSLETRRVWCSSSKSLTPKTNKGGMPHQRLMWLHILFATRQEENKCSADSSEDSHRPQARSSTGMFLFRRLKSSEFFPSPPAKPGCCI
ncbi:hypothetical protein HanRHA438_Chr05g0203231 [Helianthus annuus]|nr:hypothetical protein HanRHA438_Chr05g0203231 [Helianthus annuus]